MVFPAREAVIGAPGKAKKRRWAKSMGKESGFINAPPYVETKIWHRAASH
jgi:hypothetical protein